MNRPLTPREEAKPMDTRKQDPEFYATVRHAERARRMCKAIEATDRIRAVYKPGEGFFAGSFDVFLIPPHPLCVEATLQRIFG